MRLKQKYSGLLIMLVLIITSILSCKKIPKFDKIPVIDFKAINTYTYLNTDQMVNADSVVMTVHIKDGDGDIGNEANDRNDNNINYFVDVYRKTNGIFNQVTLDPGLSYNGHTPLLNPISTPGPIEADLSYKISFLYFNGQAENDTLKFLIKIKDRAGNFSNTVETLPVVIRKK